MNGEVTGLVIVLLVAATLSRLVSIPHMNRVFRQMNTIRRSGSMSSVGVKKDWRGMRVYILIADENGHIQKGYALTGNTIFSRFKEDKALVERTPEAVLQQISARKRLRRIDKAKKDAAAYLLEADVYKEALAAG